MSNRIKNILFYIGIILVTVLFCAVQIIKSYCYIGASVILIGLMIAWIIRKPKDSENFKKGLHFWAMFFATILLLIGVILEFLAIYARLYFATVSLNEIRYNLAFAGDGANMSTFQTAFRIVIALVIFVIVAVIMVDLFLKKIKKREKVVMFIVSFSIMTIFDAYILADKQFQFKEYYEMTHTMTALYDDYYVLSSEVQIIAPDKKRNIIYIVLESMETTYASENVGGAIQGDNFIPNLTRIATDNYNFAEEGNIGGAYAMPGAAFTAGALVAQTSGTPINEAIFSNAFLNSNWSESETFLPKVLSLGDILSEEGYNQEFMCGSDASFGGRKTYFQQHGNYEIFDLLEAKTQEKLPEDYLVWWGYEDAKLVEFAKEEILRLANEDKPFNFTMLTVDTHFTNGYTCEDCEQNYDLVYSNVIACSDNKISELIGWIQEQDFYENTTIVVAGDHPVMDSAYISDVHADNYPRRVFFCVINPVDSCENIKTSRQFTTFDIYPTMLASMGFQIDGDKLGFGTNLFSGKETLIEEVGLENIKKEFNMDSYLYRYLME